MAVNHSQNVLDLIDSLLTRVADLEASRTLGPQAPKLIRPTTLAAPAASVTFSAIPAYSNLRLEWRARLTSGGPTDLEMQVDANSSALYLWSKMESASASQANFHSGAAATLMKIGAVGGSTAGYFGNGSLTIAGWANATGYVSFSGTSAHFDSNSVDYIGTYGGLYASVAPHNSLMIFPASGSFAAGSQFSLYGVN